MARGCVSSRRSGREIQQASAARINLYEEKVAEVTELLRQAHADEVLLDVSQWPLVKEYYIALIDLRFDDELAETWFNSIFAGCSSTIRSAMAACSRASRTHPPSIAVNW